MENPTRMDAKNYFDRYPISNLRPSRAFIWSLAAIKCAAAEVNRERGLLDARRADAIIQAAQEVSEGLWDDQFIADPLQAGPSDYQRMTNSVIATRATQILDGQANLFADRLPVHPDEHVALNQSGAEVISAAIRLGCLSGLEALLECLGKLTPTPGTKSIKWLDALISPQEDAQASGAAWMSRELREYIHAISRDAECLRNAGGGLRRLSIKGASTGATPTDQLEYQARMLKALEGNTGLSISPSDHSSQSMQAMAEIDAFSTALRNLLVSLTRTADKFNQQEATSVTGSGTAQLLNKIKFQLQVCDLTIALAAQGGSTERNGLMPVITYLLFEAVQGLTEAARLLVDHIPGGPADYLLRFHGFPVSDNFLGKESYGSTVTH